MDLLPLNEAAISHTLEMICENQKGISDSQIPFGIECPDVILVVIFRLLVSKVIIKWI